MFRRLLNQVKIGKRSIWRRIFSKRKKHWIFLCIEKTFKEKDQITKHPIIDSKRN